MFPLKFPTKKPDTAFAMFTTKDKRNKDPLDAYILPKLDLSKIDFIELEYTNYEVAETLSPSLYGLIINFTTP